MAEQTKCNKRHLPLICRVQLKACKNLANGYSQRGVTLLRVLSIKKIEQDEISVAIFLSSLAKNNTQEN